MVDGLKQEVVNHLRLVGVDLPLERFDATFAAFQKEYVALCEDYIQTPHQFVVFTK